jgi:hypothetical protein
MAEESVIEYSISCGQELDGKSACIWRTQGAVSEKIARFTSKKAALIMAKDFNWPLHESTMEALSE